MDVFNFRDRLVADYQSYVRSFIQIRDPKIREHVDQHLGVGVLWPEALIQLNPSFEFGEKIDDLVHQGILHPECSRIFCAGKSPTESRGKPMQLHRHQADAIRAAQTGSNYVLTTGTGSGKSLSYIIPIVDHVLKRGSKRGIQAIVIYPMNALANSQYGELEKFLRFGYAEGKEPVTFAKYTGQEREEERAQIIANPPDILLTNYVMLELILTRPAEQNLIAQAQGLRFLVLDELHTYRGRQGADVGLLMRRTRDMLNADKLQFVGTSATLAGTGTYLEQRREVAQVASQIFGTTVQPGNVIGETLRRATADRSIQDPVFLRELTARVLDMPSKPPRNFDAFNKDPLSIWIETTFGVTREAESDRLIRAKPTSITGNRGAAQQLSQLTGASEDRCASEIQEGLLAGYQCDPDPTTGFHPFAFRLHQFISRGDTVYASLESEDERHITLNGQQFVPHDRSRILLPIVFCRECGQEYYVVRQKTERDGHPVLFEAREPEDQSDHEGIPGYLYASTANPWPNDEAMVLTRIPGDWIEDTTRGQRVRTNRSRYLPEAVNVKPNGEQSADGMLFHFVAAPFRFCLHCGVAYGFRQGDDFAKLASLASEGRSTATTILSLSSVRFLRDEKTLEPNARKLLSFTDNRQDASLQAGHFNDFIEVGLLRAALYRAVVKEGPEGLTHDLLTQRVFDALQLDPFVYATAPNARVQMRDTDKALRNVLGYRLYRDLKRGWRITSPNLEQCGLLEIRYNALDEICRDEKAWSNRHVALVSALPETRLKVSKTLLDYMRRELAIKVDYLDERSQETIQQQSSQRLISPWAIDENERMEHAAVLYPRSQQENDYGGNAYLSARGGFGQYLKRRTTFHEFGDPLPSEQIRLIINDLLEVLCREGFIEQVDEPHHPNDVPGYQLSASALLWVAGDGSKAFHDPITVPNESAVGARTNPFFVDFYRSFVEVFRLFNSRDHSADGSAAVLEAREHTAQVPYDDRQEREQRFRKGELPILYCSPTMELGVDIKDLNAVNMRNVPPTPANYAQRSGRAGRSGQPALVFTYCTTGSPHDQYFFKRPELMVRGQVAPPRLDLANEDLVRAHVHAIWLAETHLKLGKSLKDVLDVNGEHPTLELQQHVRDAIEAIEPRKRAQRRAQTILETFVDELRTSDWYRDGWLERELSLVGERFNKACERWRTLYKAARSQAENQNRIILDASRSPDDKKQAERMRRESEEQLKLLTEVENIAQSDFYSYRYFASEGFLPGYSFPRLPLSAFIPARRTKQKDEFLSRPRFLAISEFGPRAIVYHEGSRYVINKVILPVEDRELLTRDAKLCKQCGYLHPIGNAGGADRCERCNAMLQEPYQRLFRLQNVATKRRDKINSDEEERMRQGFELITGVRFADPGEYPAYRVATIEKDGAALGKLTYGHSATLWRINLGWSRRQDTERHGFMLDVDQGYWEKEPRDGDDQGDSLGPRVQRVIPYVEDRRNCLLFEPTHKLDVGTMVSFQAALKNAIQVLYQLEDNELAVEVLPSKADPRLILFYESAEGGAGVLRRLLDDTQAFAGIAKEALAVCHYTDTGEDLHRAHRAQEDCEAACYDCLMSYYNQRDHDLLDRKLIRDLLLDLSEANVISAPATLSRGEHLQRLNNLAGSDLEREWLAFLEDHGHHLPTKAQPLISTCSTQPDFYYEPERTVIYIDGPHHDYAERKMIDATQQECLENLGYMVIRFGFKADWAKTIAQFPSIFGRTQ